MNGEWWSLGQLEDLLDHEFSKKVSWKTMTLVHFHYDRFSFPIRSNLSRTPFSTNVYSFVETLKKLKKKAKT